MAYEISQPPAATPSSISSGSQVTISFRVKRLSGNGALQITYAGNGVTLGGQGSVSRSRHITDTPSTVSEIFDIVGPAGQSSIGVDIRDSDNSDHFEVFLDIS